MEIRDATASDIPEMQRIRSSVRENALDDPNSVQRKHYEAMLTVRGRGWVAQIGGRMVGFAIADATSTSVWALFVDPQFEAQGIGRKLHDRMLGWMFDQGYDLVRLSTTPNTRAERFYQAAGWRYLRPSGGGEVYYELSRDSWHNSQGRSPGASDSKHQR